MAARDVRAFALDVALAIVGGYIAILLTTEVYGALAVPARTAALLLAAVHGAALAFRRVAPRAVLGVQIATAIAYVALGLPIYMLGFAVLVTIYTVASRLDRRTAVAALIVAEATLAVLIRVGPSFPGLSSWMLFSAIVAAAWFLGDIVRRWQTAAAAHERRAAELERAREELARLAVTAERLRIARELHDVVAHGMSVIAMHAGSARLAVGRDPAAERKALEVIEEASRTALAEMRRLVAVLREADDAAPALAPARGVADMHALVADMAGAGVGVDVQVEGDLSAVPEGVSVAAYRIVQEALTNVAQHARPARARLSVVVGEDGIRLSVSDDGRSASRSPSAAGHGLVGMRERAALYGGELVAGPAPDGGWRVSAWLPWPGSAE